MIKSSAASDRVRAFKILCHWLRRAPCLSRAWQRAFLRSTGWLRGDLSGISRLCLLYRRLVAVQGAIPNADIGLAMLCSLGITFPFNVMIGIPLYHQFTQWSG